VTFLHEGSSQEQAQAFVDDGRADQPDDDLRPDDRQRVLHEARCGICCQEDLARAWPGSPRIRSVGVLIASGPEPCLANNTIINCNGCSPLGAQDSAQAASSPGITEGGSIGVFIAPGDALLAGLFSSPKSDETSPQVQAPATGSGTQDPAEDNIHGWNTAGILIACCRRRRPEMPAASAPQATFRGADRHRDPAQHHRQHLRVQLFLQRRGRVGCDVMNRRPGRRRLGLCRRGSRSANGSSRTDGCETANWSENQLRCVSLRSARYQDRRSPPSATGG